jgi:hypothetical protein
MDDKGKQIASGRRTECELQPGPCINLDQEVLSRRDVAQDFNFTDAGVVEQLYDAPRQRFSPRIFSNFHQCSRCAGSGQGT